MEAIGTTQWHHLNKRFVPTKELDGVEYRYQESNGGGHRNGGVAQVVNVVRFIVESSSRNTLAHDVCLTK